MKHKVIIHVIRHSNGEFGVYKNLGLMPGPDEREGKRFTTRDDAMAHAKQLQREAGGPNHAEIVAYDAMNTRRPGIFR